MNPTTYIYKDKDNKEFQIELPEKLQNIKLQADTDYQTSKDYIQTYEFHTWRGGYKAYHLSTYDRKIQLGDQHWRQNITIGLIRSFVDVLKSVVNEKPLTFIGTGINKTGIQNKENILKTLNYISDVSGFHKQLKNTMGDGLITGEIALRIGYKQTTGVEKVISIVNGTHIEETITSDPLNYPYAEKVSIFNIFPDPYTGNLRNVTERGVVGYEKFIETFGHLIRHKKNESPLKGYEFLASLPINELPGTDYTDYGNIKNQIHEKVNAEFKQKDKYGLSSYKQTNSKSSTNFDESKAVTEGLIEFKITWYKTRVVLLANGYPVYIGENIYGFIPYVIRPSNDTDTRFGEGIPYLLKGLEDVGNSFINNYFDSARSIANPTMIVNKNLMIDDEELEGGVPGGIVYTENNDGGNAVYRLDKGGLQDFNIMNILQQIAQQITGISEYNLGQSAGERTASGALAVTQSSNKRMGPYLSNFLDAISVVAVMWLELVKKFRNKEQFIYILDDEGGQTEATIKNKDLMGKINISLQSEGMFGSVNELEMQKLVTMYNLLAPSGFINAQEISKEIIKKAGFSPSKFFIDGTEEKMTPDNMNSIETPLEDSNADLGQIIQKAVNPQPNLNNKGQGSKY